MTSESGVGMGTYRDLADNPLFERIDCPVCGSSNLRSFFAIPYGSLKEKKSLDHSKIGVGPESVLNVDECSGCRFVFANPRIKPEYQDRVYNESKQSQCGTLLSGTGAAEDQVGLRRKRLQRLPVLLRLLRMVGGARELSLLDVGAGLGHTLALARELGIDGYGTELDRARISYCRRSNLNVCSPDELDSKYPESKFDMIVVQSVIEHVVDLNGFMAWVAGRAKRGSVLFMNGLTPDKIRLERKRNYFVEAHFIEHVNFFPIRSLDLLMQKYGFYPVKRHMILLNSGSFTVPEFVPRALNALRRRSADGGFARYYRYRDGRVNG